MLLFQENLRLIFCLKLLDGYGHQNVRATTCIVLRMRLTGSVRAWREDHSARTYARTHKVKVGSDVFYSNMKYGLEGTPSAKTSYIKLGRL